MTAKVETMWKFSSELSHFCTSENLDHLLFLWYKRLILELSEGQKWKSPLENFHMVSILKSFKTRLFQLLSGMFDNFCVVKQSRLVISIICLFLKIGSIIIWQTYKKLEWVWQYSSVPQKIITACKYLKRLYITQLQMLTKTLSIFYACLI